MKVLICLKYSDLKPRGGPAGYCFNLFSELQKDPNNFVYFLPDDDSSTTKKKLLYLKITSRLPRFINSFQIAIRRKREYQKLLKKPQLYSINFNDYDIIHFHSTISLFKFRLNLANYKGKIVLTSHSPVPQHLEIYEELPTRFEKILFKKFYKQLVKIDQYSFKRSDYVLFPCKEAEEPYYKLWDEYKMIHDSLISNDRLLYLLTGVPKIVISKTVNELRNEYGYSGGDFIISYVGRHNKVKGYDLFKQLFLHLAQIQCDVKAIVGGIEKPLKGLNDKNWKEIGWTDKPYELIYLSDVFILPNRETYFDIVFLEALSLGKIIVASNTGGNRYFSQFKGVGIFLFSSLEESAAIIKHISEMNKNELLALGKKNIELYEKMFTTKDFAKNYLELYKSIHEND